MYRSARQLCAALCVLASLLASPAHAAEPDCTGQIDDRVRVVVTCRPGYATEQDVIEVYRRTPAPDDMAWQAAMSQDDAIWVFMTGSARRAALIIDFHISDGVVTADLYDDQNGDGVLRYSLSGTQLQIEEPSPNPSVSVQARGGWWLASGEPNMNIDMTIDSRLPAMIEVHYLDSLKTDGRVDYTIQVRDSDADGKPDYELRQAYPPLDEDSGFYHSAVMVNPRDDEPAITNGLFWPLLGSGMDNFVKAYRVSPPPINMDWGNRKISLIGEFVASRGSPHNYFVYSTKRIAEGQLNQVNFEAPFAFYGLGGPNPQFPDLSIRTAYWPQPDLVENTTVEQVDVTWRFNDSSRWAAPNWDYRLGLLGRNAHRGSVDLGAFSMAITPYDDLPAWVAEGTWDYGTFVARESGEYLTTEHIYEWATLEGVINDISAPAGSEDKLQTNSVTTLLEYVRGRYEGDIGRFYQRIRVGLRGEFSPAMHGQPRMYLSPIDGKLHLLRASHGVWNIDGRSELRYADRDGDGYFDQWTYSQASDVAGELLPAGQLNQSASHLLYSGQGGLVLRAAAAQQPLDMLPPITPEQWQTQRQQLEAAQPTSAAGDLLAMLRQFDGPEQRVSGATVRDYRPTADGGFRFVLDLQPGYSLGGEDVLGLSGLAPGVYVAAYDGVFSLALSTPPAIEVALPAQEMQQLAPSMLQLQLSNRGMEDVQPALVDVTAVAPDGRSTVVMSQTVTLLAQLPVTANITWAPPSAGEWQLVPRLRYADGAAETFPATTVRVQPVPALDTGVLVTQTASPSSLSLLAFAALMLAAIAGFAAWAVWGAPVEMRTHNER